MGALRVWVVVADYGLGGVDCLGVFTEKPNDALLEKLENTPYDSARPWGTPRSFSGYSGLEAMEREVQ